MSPWTGEELDRIGSAEELQLTASGRTVTIWVVRVGDGVYVRSVRGRMSRWFRGVLEQHEGRISAGGVDRDVAFVEVDDAEEIGEAYRSKYGGRYPASYVDPMLSAEARAATLKLVPRS